MKNYPAKLLLFGEHTVNLSSQALAVPLPLFSGKWALAKHLSSSELAARQMQLPQLAEYLDRLQQRGELLAQLDVEAFRQALAEGLVFESDIPMGYGAGSSGALVAGVLGNWKLGNWEIVDRPILELKKALAQMEAFFHGTSSGTDPLVCFLQKPVLLGGEAGAQIVEIPTSFSTHQIFLLDTGMPRQATPFIEYFLEKMRDEAFAEHCREGLLPSVEAAIAGFLAGNGQLVFEEVHRIGGFQLRNLEALIPEKFRPIWQQGLDGDLFKLKVCGAGGGGFILGITPDFEATKKALAGHKLLAVMGV
jgi:mevalonate kinase